MTDDNKKMRGKMTEEDEEDELSIFISKGEKVHFNYVNS